MQRVGTALVALQREGVALQKIEDGDLALMIDIGGVAADGA